MIRDLTLLSVGCATGALVSILISLAFAKLERRQADETRRRPRVRTEIMWRE